MEDIGYPLGIQTFSEIIRKGLFYVDKTALIYNLVHKRKYVFLSRPRRFGKSLLMSTIESYMLGEKDLFKGLAIDELEHDWTAYPVFHLDFSGDDSIELKVLKNKIINYLRKWERKYQVDPVENLGDRFYNILEAAYEQTGRGCVVLIDEYDKPMLDSLHDNELHASVKSQLRGFYSNIKRADRYIRFVMITGVSKFSKVSIFSGLNNLKDISMIPVYNDICGFSESEFRMNFDESIRNFAESYGKDPDYIWRKFREHYDGYHFALPGEGIYNPYSVLNAFDEGKFKDYWYQSGTPGYLPSLIQRSDFSLKQLDKIVCTEQALSDISDPEKDLVPLLYQTGYLTLKDYDEGKEAYTLDFPNEEVFKGFWTSLAEFFFKTNGSNIFDRDVFVRDLEKGNPDAFMTRLRSLLADTPLHPRTDKEVYFQNVLLTVGKMLGMQVSTEVHSASGRCDMIITTRQFLYIFEFKIDSTPKDALKQILDKGYHLPYEADPRIKFLIGANFSTKERILSGWDIETL